MFVLRFIHNGVCWMGMQFSGHQNTILKITYALKWNINVGTFFIFFWCSLNAQTKRIFSGTGCLTNQILFNLRSNYIFSILKFLDLYSVLSKLWMFMNCLCISEAQKTMFSVFCEFCDLRLWSKPQATKHTQIEVCILIFLFCGILFVLYK